MSYAPDAIRICPQCQQRTAQPRCPECGTGTVSLERDSDPLIGATVGTQYQIVARVGRGGMGVVYRAIQLSVERPVAIKVISQRFVSDVTVVRRFEREARLTSKLQHPNSIRVYDFGLTEAGLPYLVMELLEGRELQREIRDVGQMPLPRAIHLATQVLKALHEAHGHGIVHRDLKPANIFLHRVPGETDMVKVMDFGIAKVFNEQAEQGQTLTQAGIIVGTPQYMSPEQCCGDKVDHRSDLYSLGIILYQMLAGRTPFVADTPMGILVKQAQELAPPISDFRPDLVGNGALQDAFGRMLAKNAEDRPASALHAIQLLHRAAPTFAETAHQPLDELDTDAFRRMEEARRGQLAPTTPPARPGLIAAMLADGDGDATTTRRDLPGATTSSMAHAAPVSSDDAPDEEEATEERKPRRKSAMLVVAAGGAIVVTVGVLMSMAGGTTVPPPVPVEAPPVAVIGHDEKKPADPAPEPLKPAREVRLSVRSTPARASVFVDGVLMGVSPLDGLAVVGGKSITLEVRKDGYRTTSLDVQAEEDRTVEVQLVAQAHEAEPRKPARAPRKAPARKTQSDAELLEDL